VKKAVLENLLDKNYASVSKKIERFISSYISKSPAAGVAVGLSGGLDSSVVLKLSVNALGPEKVAGFILPSSTTPEQDVKDAVSLAESLKIDYKIIDTSSIISKYLEVLSGSTDKIRGNLVARIRMSILYHEAAIKNYLVAGTSDKSEFLIGYFTKFGDGGSDLLPIAGLYKTQVRALATYLGIPEGIVKKKSSPALWKGQLAEKELGMEYEIIDPILVLLDRKLTARQAAKKLQLPVKDVIRVQAMIKASAHKRKIAEAANIEK
jgi:NAD+ synthase